MIPKPSVALCRAKPTTSTVARAISLPAAAWPMARLSATLCGPMPTAMSSDSCLARDHPATRMRVAGGSAPLIAPGPLRAPAATVDVYW